MKIRDSDYYYAASGYPIKAPATTAALPRDVSHDFGQIAGQPGVNPTSAKIVY